MDLKGSLVDTNLRIYPSTTFIQFLDSLPKIEGFPVNIINIKNGNKDAKQNSKVNKVKDISYSLNNEDLKYIQIIKKSIKETNQDEDEEDYKSPIKSDKNNEASSKSENNNEDQIDSNCNEENKLNDTDIKPVSKEEDSLYLHTQDIDWLYSYLQGKRKKGDKNVPYLHDLLEGSRVEVPENEVIKRNPVLEARCVKLRAQQEAREYRQMTKGVDNVRIRYPEDNINFQLKQINRQLIAIGQFIISIFAGFLFGFRGVEWMVGNLDFGFRMLLGVMCALVIALAEIYFLAKKLNEELNMSQAETIQLGGPPKLAPKDVRGKDDVPMTKPSNVLQNGKQHQD